jgi:hypothetical protein
VRDDGPTEPNPRWHDEGTRDSGGPPTWPGASTHTGHSSPSDIRPMLLGASLAVNGILFVALLSVLLLTRAGAFSTANSPGQSGTQVSASTATPTRPLSTPTSSLSGWLRVTPTNVRLGCDPGQQTQFAVLQNTGPHDVQWQAHITASSDQAGIEVGPNQGSLRAGTSMSIQIRNRSHTSGRRGVIRFDPMDPAAGPAPSLTYTTSGCG